MPSENVTYQFFQWYEVKSCPLGSSDSGMEMTIFNVTSPIPIHNKHVVKTVGVLEERERRYYLLNDENI